MLLDEDRSSEFHHTVAQLPFVTSKPRKYIKMELAFLCTQVRILDEDDWENLLRVLRYTRGTLYIPLVLRAGILSSIKWWVDASFDAHPYCKGHTGAMPPMGSGSIMGILRKQKINGRISTETNIVVSDDVFPQCL